MALVHRYPATPEDSRKISFPIFIALCTLGGMVGFDQNALLSALPSIGREFHATAEFVMVQVSYLAASTVVVLIYGRFSDIFGRKVVLLSGISIFVAGSTLAASAQNLTMLIVGRAIQGLGGGGFLMLANTIIADLVPPRERARYSASFLMIYGVFSISGGPLGAFITAAMSWRLNMWINVPVSLGVGFLLSLKMGNLRRNSATMDWAGMALFCLLFGAVSASGFSLAKYGPSAATLGLAVMSIALAAALILVEKNRENAFFQVTLFKNNRLTLCFLEVFLVNFPPIAAITLLPIYLQTVRSVSIQTTGVIMACTTIGVIVGSRISAIHTRRRPHFEEVAFVGIAATYLGCALLAAVTIYALPLSYAAAGISLIGIGSGYSQPPLMIISQMAVAPTQLGSAMGIGALFRVGSAAIAATLCSTILSSQAVHHILEPAQYHDSVRDAFRIACLCSLATAPISFMVLALIKRLEQSTVAKN